MENTKIVIKLEGQQLIIDVEGAETKYDLQEQEDHYELELTPDEVMVLGKNLVKGIKCQGCGRKGALRRDLPDGHLWLCTFCACCEEISRGNNE